MSDASIPNPAPIVLTLAQRNAWVHTVLGLVALVALFASTMPRFAAYQQIIVGICAVLGYGSIASAKAHLPPRVRAILDSFSPAPVITPPAPTDPAVKP